MRLVQVSQYPNIKTFPRKEEVVTAADHVSWFVNYMLKSHIVFVEIADR